MLSNILKNVNLLVDGVGMAGEFEEVTLPKMTLVEEDFRGGGMDAAVGVDLGMEKLEAEFVTTKIAPDTMALFGLAPGQLKELSVYGALVSETDGTVKKAAAKMTGQIKEVDTGAWKPGEKATTKFSMTLSYYELEIDGAAVYRIDVPNFIREINGTDQLAEQRAALGIG